MSSTPFSKREAAFESPQPSLALIHSVAHHPSGGTSSSAAPGDSQSTVAARREQIQRSWERLSRASAWLRFGEWRNEAVDTLCEVMAEGGDAAAAVARLGSERAYEGVGLSETLDDLRCGLVAGGYLGHEIELIKELALAWSETTIDPAARKDWVDPISGLVNTDYLHIRLHEIYERHGAAASEHYCFIVIDGHVQGSSTWSRDARDMVLGQAVRRACSDGQTKTKLGNGTIVVLDRRDIGMSERFETIKEIVSDHARSSHAVQIRRPARIWIEGLPSQPELAAALLDSLAT